MAIRWPRCIARPLALALAVVLGLALIASACSDGVVERARVGEERADLVVAVDAYLARPVSDRALDLVAEIERGGVIDEAPYLVDLIRVIGSSVVRTAAIEVLARLRDDGPVPLDDNLAYVELGSWALDQSPRPGPAYRRFKAALYGSLDERFAPLLEQVEDVATLVGIQWGGVHLGAIRELNRPVRSPAATLRWPVDTEVVFAVDVADQIVVYPRRVIGRHELANDEITDPSTGQRLPFGVSYCSLCRTAVAFDRRVGGRELTFKTSGLLLGANKVMVDDQTGTLWQQASGEAVAGPLAGTRLDLLPVRVVAFGELEGDPLMVDLPVPFIPDPETGTLTTYAYTDTEPLPDYLAGGRLWFPVTGVGTEEDPLSEVATVVVGGAALAVDVDALEPGQAVELVVGNARVRVEQGLAGPRFVEVTGAGSGAELATGREAWFSWLARHPDTDRWPSR